MSIEIQDYHFSYALSNKPALDGINLLIETGGILLLCGASGSGKSTLLRNLKKSIAPAGVHHGAINGLPDDTDIAVVFQNPETQLVTTTVINDLVFQMENRGMNPLVMKQRMSETVGFFGLEEILHKPVDTLSGGQKQITALCAALMCEPKLLLLDEPVSQLDPLSAAAFIEAVRRVNTELGITVVMAEHRLEECAAITDRIAFMQNGRILHEGTVTDVLTYLYKQGRAVYVPQLARVSLAIDSGVALTPRDFRTRYSNTETHRKLSKKNMQPMVSKPKQTILRVTDAAVRYNRAEDERMVLKRVNLSCDKGEILCIVGGNGSGKTTLLKLAAGIVKPYIGRVRSDAKQIGYMPQQVRDFFLRDNAADELTNLDDTYTCLLTERLGINHLLQNHPFDLSGGEQQKLVLAAILSCLPDLLILDEPTKGMDISAKKVLADLLRESGAAVLIATHDMEFAAEQADRCAMLFDGEIAYSHPPHEFFMQHTYYTTAIHKGLRHIDENAVDLQDAYTLWGINEDGVL